MSTKRWILFLLGTAIVATLVNAAIFFWGLWPAPQSAAQAANVVNRAPAQPPKVSGPPPVAEPQPIPGPSTSAAHPEAWWPAPLTAESAARRAASDAFFMRSKRLADSAPENVRALQGELIGQHYDDVEKQLDEMLAKSVADPAYDFVERDTSGFVDGFKDGGAYVPYVDGPVIDAWVSARPKSAWAHFSAGMRLLDQAQDARGEHAADQVSDEHWAMMRRYAKQGRAEFKKALALNPKIMMAWVGLLNLDKMDSGTGSVWQDYIEGSKQRPYTYLLPDQIEAASEPRWGGDYKVMDALAQKTVAKIDQNPRFWELMGYAASDRGYGAVDEHCTPCTHEDWITSLREYNAALAYSDRPTWLIGAANAALRLQRYAVAYQYMERAQAYEPNRINLKAGMAVLQALCDPNWSRQKFESLRQDSIQYGLIEDLDYPRVPGDCSYHQAELPWGSEPLPGVSGVSAYSVNPIANPTIAQEPMPTGLSAKVNSTASPDGAWTVTLAEGGPGGSQRLQLREQATGKTTDIYITSGLVIVGFSSNSKRLFISDMTLGVVAGGCRYIDPADPTHHVDLKPMVMEEVAGEHLSIDDSTLRVICSQFINDDTLNIGLSGHDKTNGTQIFRQFHYDVVSGALTAVTH